MHWSYISLALSHQCYIRLCYTQPRLYQSLMSWKYALYSSVIGSTTDLTYYLPGHYKPVFISQNYQWWFLIKSDILNQNATWHQGPVISGSSNALKPVQHHVITRTKADSLLIGPLGIYLSKIPMKFQNFSFQKIYFRMVPAKWHPCFSFM